MTPLARVRRARSVLAAAMLGGVVLWAVAAGAAALVLLTLLHAAGALPAEAGALLVPFQAVVVAVTLAVLLWRARFLRSVERVALWVEEQVPDLRYALVTAVDPRYAPSEANGRTPLLEAAGRVALGPLVRRAAARTLLRAATACGVALGALLLVRAYAPLRAHAAALRPGGPAELANRLAKLRAEVIPPAYSGLKPEKIADPSTVRALIGSAVRFRGDGPADGVTAVVGKDTARAEAAGRDWMMPFTMPAKGAVVQFHDRAYHRLVVLQPQPDSAPRVTLRLPANDTTYRLPPRGQLVLEADAEDDLGLERGFFEILVSTGSAESFETVDRSTASVKLGGVRRAPLRAVLDFAALRLGPGSVVHVRAIAFDRNDVDSVPGKGMSETRTLRVATPQEYDTVSITAADPLPIDSLFVSQRLLNMRTDTLIRLQKPRLSQDQYVDTSITYSNNQETIRQRVEKVITILEDDGVGGRSETEASKLLREASEQMWQGRTYLAIGQPDSAYPPPKSYMKEALRLLDEARTAQRYHIRGVLRSRPVNLERVRLQGQDSAAAEPRKPRPIPENVRRRLLERLGRATALVRTAPAAALDSLVFIQVDAAADAPAVASALGEAVEAGRRKQAIGPALARAQRLLEPASGVTAGPAEWGGGLP